MRKSSVWLVFVSLFILPFVMGQGCPGVNETNEGRAYRVCTSIGISSDSTHTFIQMIEADLLNGYSYSEEVAGGVDGCNSGCGYEVNCEGRCYNCIVAIVDAVYNGKDSTVRKEKLDDEVSATPTAPNQLHEWLQTHSLPCSRE